GMIQTGQLGDVMKESIHAAMTVVRSRAESLGIAPDFYQKQEAHIHVPEGATPKDGPSAGIGMCTALVSALTGIPVKADVAMTGEITLRGEVLPIGGLKEKLLAAHRGGIKMVVIPEENEKDLVEIPKNVKEGLDIRPVKWIDEVFDLALTRRPEPAEVVAAQPAKSRTTKKRSARKGSVTKH
ncbi:S16 family serine protease, partial [Solemya elarraichensis gill symbiont]